MDLKINASELKDNVLFAGTDKHKDNKNASGRTVLGANLNLANDPIEDKKQEAVIEGNKEAIAEARQQQQNNHSTTDVSVDDIVDAAVSMKTSQNVQQGLDDIKKSMNLLEADLKGMKVDEEV